MILGGKSVRSKRDLLDLQEESWTPPAYSGGKGLFARLRTALFLFLDLQAVTIRKDLSLLLPQIEGNVLDVGCGLQPFRPFFTDKVHYLGIDTANAEAHFGYRTPDTRYYSGDIWPVKDRSIDFLLCTETLEHVAKPQIFLKEAARVMKPGARALFTIPFMARWHFIPYDYQRFTPSGLKLLFEENGFKEVKVFARGNLLTVVCYKTMAFMFSLLAKAPIWARLPRLVLGVALLPLLLFVTLLAHLSLFFDGTTDCLGYTFQATRAPGKPRVSSRKGK